jgi:phytanoyl-CoA hydroxylase
MITNEQANFYQENGYLLVENVFNSEEVNVMRDAIDRMLHRATEQKKDHNRQWQGDFLPNEEVRKLVLKGAHGVQFNDAAFSKAIIHPNMVSILQQLIGPNVQLHHTKMLVKPPAKGATFPMHQDYPYLPHTKHTVMAGSIHLDDADEENGCIYVIPGTHKLGPLPTQAGGLYLDHREYPIEAGIACPAKSGDVLFFNYLTIHGSKPNLSDRYRRNVLIQYRDPADLPAPDHRHVNWGQGMMVSGEDPVYREYVGEFRFND